MRGAVLCSALLYFMGVKDYVNNDMCYPAILNVGQMIAALQSGVYDLNRTKLLMPTAGDACRGSNYTGALRRAVKAAGFPQVQVLSLNVQGLEKGDQMKQNAVKQRHADSFGFGTCQKT